MDISYKKRPGTSSISGQLYATKFISLLLFRLLHNDDIEDFCLASNMDDDIEASDGIRYVKIKIKRHKPIILYILVKHKDNDDKSKVFDNNNDLLKWSDSILKIKQKLGSGKICDNIFSDKHSDNECIFILYTNGKWGFDSSNAFESTVSAHLNPLLTTKTRTGIQPVCTEKLAQDLSIKICEEEISNLAEHLSRYLHNDSMNIMNDEFIVKYHVILALKVFNVSEIQCDAKNPDVQCRQLTFRPEFFNTDDHILVLFKRHIYENFCLSASNLVYKLKTSSVTDQNKSNEKHTSPLTIDEEEKTDVINILLSFTIRVPVTFGNIDLSITGNVKKIESKLNELANVIKDLCQKSKQEDGFNIITIDDTIHEGLLSFNEDLAGIVGNVLIYDEDSNLYKFTDSASSLMNNANTLYNLLQSKIDNMHEYRIEVKTLRFPRLTFDYTDVAKKIFDNVIVYAKQSNHYGIEEELKKAIDLYNISKGHDISVQTDSIFLYYHNEIQKWWMSTEIETYLTKTCDIYQRSLNNILKEPQMTKLQNVFNINKVRNILYTFNENAMQSMSSLENISRSVIVTEVTVLTTLKVIQYLRNQSISKYVVLDLEYMLNMNTEDFSSFIRELKSTEKIIIIVCDNMQGKNILNELLEKLLHVLEQKHIIFVIHNTLAEVIKIYFTSADDNLITDKINIFDITPASRTDLISNANVIFQGCKSGLDILLDDKSIELVNGAVLNKIIRNETINIGETLNNSSYEKTRRFYVERRINLVSDNEHDNREYEVKSLLDLTDETVLVIAKPGMGKSTLLTHLSLKTKEIDSTFWIVRINLLDYSKTFHKWQEDRKVIDAWAAFSFIVLTIIKRYDIHVTLRESNDIVYIKDCMGDEWGKFQLNLYLSQYNKRKVIFLFDGFDEISPNYVDCVITFLNVVRNSLRQYKMWVTSRPYSDILPELTRVLGRSYEIGYLNDLEQELYANKIWQTELIFDNLHDFQINNAISFMYYIKNIREAMSSNDTLNYNFFNIYNYFYNYLYSHFPHIETLSNSVEMENYIMRENHSDSQNTDVVTLLGTPLLLYLIADYLMNIIRVRENANEWKLSTNIHYIFTMFIELKLKAILFQDKNKMDIYDPNIKSIYETERKDCWNLHKKMAVYVILGCRLFWGSKFKEFKKMNLVLKGDVEKLSYKELFDRIDSIKSGTEKTGLISYITDDNVPVFIHRTFAQYFTAEYLCDILKNDKFKFNHRRLLLTAITTCCVDDVLPWIYKKREMDNELHATLVELENNLPISCWRFKCFQSLCNFFGGIFYKDQELERNIRKMNAMREWHDLVNLYLAKHYRQ